MIEATAPGKIVLWGEYAVLHGAPALVMAVNRYASCRLQPLPTDHWQFTASGYAAADATLTRPQLLDAEPPPRDRVWFTFWHVLQALDVGRLPAGGRVQFDTRTFHHQGAKLGLGSSAALCVTVYGAVCRLLDQPADLATALAIHRRLQGAASERTAASEVRAGSGIDVAAAWQGGTLRFSTDGGGIHTDPVALPEPLQTAFVWTGSSTRTTDHLQRLQDWLEAGGGTELDALGARARHLFEAPDPLVAMTDYVDALRELDRAAGLGIFSDAHDHLARLAIAAGVVYKPCGAGGGDVGAAFAVTTDALEQFNRLAAAAGFLPLALETAPHGIEVTG